MEDKSIPVLRSGTHKPFKKLSYWTLMHLYVSQAYLKSTQADLKCASAVVFHVERDDELFYETTIYRTFLMTRTFEKRAIEYFSIDLREADPSKKPMPWERDYIVRNQLSQSPTYKGGDVDRCRRSHVGIASGR